MADPAKGDLRLREKFRDLLLIVRVDASAKGMQGQRPVHRAGVYVEKAEFFGNDLRNRALARTSRSINRDIHVCIPTLG
ncbi:hypothetical protein BSNK01_00760 [Bacillaceae bacterium]